jgi:hypothetical protein
MIYTHARILNLIIISSRFHPVFPVLVSRADAEIKFMLSIFITIIIHIIEKSLIDTDRERADTHMDIFF